MLRQQLSLVIIDALIPHLNLIAALSFGKKLRVNSLPRPGVLLSSGFHKSESVSTSSITSLDYTGPQPTGRAEEGKEVDEGGERRKEEEEGGGETEGGGKERVGKNRKEEVI